ncbi:MAG TPA: trypsin-like peptidase domain-containing protein [Vicinamibacterales bacterium]|nr:trypsin-like peptidase domain-containing protein [Vicinamibacterales bacterium]
MSKGKTTLFYAVLLSIASVAVGMVIASRLDLSPTASAAPAVSVPSTNSAPITGPIDATTFRNIAKADMPAVVNIQTESHARRRDMSEFFGGGGDDLLRRFFGQQGQGGEGENPTPRNRGRGQQDQGPAMVGAGSGFVIDKTGFILTNNHVVEGAEKIQVSFSDGAPGVSYPAKVIGRDLLTDCALIQLTEMPATPLHEVKFGDSTQMEPGDWVMAIGNPFNIGQTVTVGVISALGRPFGGVQGRTQDMLQTDAAINPGNSGGPLLNLRGEVVGMNTAIYTDQRSANIGIGFATPINTIRDLLPQLRTGKVIRGVIGVQVQSRPIAANEAKAFGLPNNNGAVISTVNPNGPADKAGLEPGDVVVEYNGQPVKDSNALVSMVVGTKPGTTVPVTVYRDGQRKALNVTIDELDLEAEQNQTARGGGAPNQNEPTTTGFGMTLDPITPDVSRRLDLPRDTGGAVVSDVDRDGAAVAAGVVPGDVILEVNRVKVNSVSQVTRELDKVQTGQPAFLLIWRDGQQVFVTMTKK